MRIVSYRNIAAIPVCEKCQIHKFLAMFIPEGTVMMPAAAYDSATSWSLLIESDGKIKGFSAHKVFEKEFYTIIQVMATFLSPEARGKKFASVLLQGDVFLRAWYQHKFKPIFWCTRTRIPAAYAATLMHCKIYPNFKSSDSNRAQSVFAESVAKDVYGSHITLDPDTFVMRQSYGENCQFLPIKSASRSRLLKKFQTLINYDKDETIFIFTKMSYKSLSTYLLLKWLYRLGSIARYLLKDKYKLTTEKQNDVRV